MKKILIPILAVLLLIGSIIFLNKCSSQSDLIENAHWSLNPDGESYRLEQLDPSYSQASYAVPETVNGKPVTVIGYSAFTPHFPNLQSITLPNTIKTIEGSAFRDCTALKSVNIPSGVTEIGEAAFENCHSLISISIPTSVKSIGNAAFHNCRSLQTISIPDSVKSIGTALFKNCTSLTSAKLPSKLSKLPENTFYGCESLTSVKIPSHVTAIETLAFWGCSSLTSIEIPNGVKTIGSFVFDGLDSLRTLTIPSSVVSLEAAPYISGKYLEKIQYDGTIEQWYQITDTSIPLNYPVHCSDGVIERAEENPSNTPTTNKSA